MESLIQKVRRGDKAATIQFYYQFSPKIERYLVKRLPALEDAQDILQVVFLEALDTISFLKEEKTVLSWLYTIARNKTADFYRKRKIKSVLLSQLPFLEIISKEVHEPEFIYEKNKIRDKIEAAFRLLTPTHQNILYLRYEEDNSVKEIANKLRLSEKAAESLLFRARQQFKLLYERE